MILSRHRMRQTGVAVKVLQIITVLRITKRLPVLPKFESRLAENYFKLIIYKILSILKRRTVLSDSKLSLVKCVVHHKASFSTMNPFRKSVYSSSTEHLAHSPRLAANPSDFLWDSWVQG